MSKRRGYSYEREEAKVGYAFVLPTLVCLSIVILFPLVRNLIMSFQNYVLTRPQELNEFNGVNNYIEVFRDSIFWTTVKQTFIFTFSSVSLKFLVGILGAMLLNVDYKIKGLFRALILIPWVIPSVVAASIWRWMLDSDMGIINQMLMNLHIISKGINWLGNETTAMISTIMVDAWRGIPFMIVTLLAGLQAIPMEMYEAAEVDGANWWHKFFKITIPQLKSIILVDGILSFIWTFNSFNIIFVMTGGGPLHKTEVLSTLIYWTAFKTFNFGQAAAISLFAVACVILFINIYTRALKAEGGDIGE